MKTDIIQKTILLNSEGNILLLRRSDTDDRRPLQWDFPGGILDPGETLEVGTIREIKEESGIFVSEVRVIFAKTEPMSWTKDGIDHEANSVRMYYSAHTTESVVTLSYEHSEYAWVSLGEALDMLEYHRHKEVIQYILDNKLVL